MQKLNVRNNKISDLPSTLGAPSIYYLTYLNLRDNQITSLPDLSVYISSLPYISILNLIGNPVVEEKGDSFKLEALIGLT
jgi:Leucine-rich repeat (LRR) protein